MAFTSGQVDSEKGGVKDKPNNIRKRLVDEFKNSSSTPKKKSRVIKNSRKPTTTLFPYRRFVFYAIATGGAFLFIA